MIKFCKQCDKEFNTARNAAKFCCLKCCQESRKKRISRKCLWCKKEFEAINYKVKQGNAKYCSRKCFEEWQSSGAKIGTNVGPQYAIKCKLCGKERLVPPCLKDTAKYCSVRCHNIGNVKFCLRHRETSIEKKLAQMLDELKVKYIRHKNIGRLTIPDFFVEPSTCIYADGDYWHNRPEVKERDIRINKELKRKGYIILRFWETDINNNTKQIIREIKEVLQCQA